MERPNKNKLGKTVEEIREENRIQDDEDRIGKGKCPHMRKITEIT